MPLWGCWKWQGRKKKDSHPKSADQPANLLIRGVMLDADFAATVWRSGEESPIKCCKPNARPVRQKISCSGSLL